MAGQGPPAGILRSATARSVREYYCRRFGDGTRDETIRFELGLAHARELGEPAFWAGLARGQWDCGWCDPEALDRLEAMGLGDLAANLLKPNPKAQGVRKRFAQPIYAPGDCLAVRLSEGDYGAALILDEDRRPRHGQPNLVGVLRYKGPALPDQAVFERREWLALTHHAHTGRLEIVWAEAFLHPSLGRDLIRVGNVPLRANDPRDSNVWSAWNFGLQIEAQYQ